MLEPVQDVWVEVDLAALRHNARQVKAAIGPDVALMAVVKGNGFGHGYVEPARAFMQAGAEWLGVTRLDEALALRQGGITAPILIMAPIQPSNAEIAVEQNLTCAVDTAPLIQALGRAAQSQGRTVGVHLKVDSGMGRLGVSGTNIVETASICHDAGVAIEGIFTHFARATDQVLLPTEKQLRSFQVSLITLKDVGVVPQWCHAANSAATVRVGESRFNLVRVGTLLYGQYPSAHVPRTLDLQPTWKLKARVCSVRELLPGTTVGYGAEFVTRRPTRTAVIPVGYADGFTLSPEGPIYRQSPLKLLARKYKRTLSVTIRGKSAPIVGRVSMQMSVADITDIPGVEVGDEVTVPALRLATGAHIPRIYLNQ